MKAPMSRRLRLRRWLKDGPYWREIDQMRRTTAYIRAVTAQMEANTARLNKMRYALRLADDEAKGASE